MKARVRKYIEQFWKGSLNEDEQRRLLADLMEQEEKLKTELQEEFEQGTIGNDELLTEERYAELLTQVHQKMGVVRSLPKARIAFRQWAAAAAVFICLGLGAYWFLFRNTAPTDPIDNGIYAAMDTMHIINNEPVEKKAMLPDGSILILSPKSKLSYNSGYGIRNRALALSGKARFQVVRDTLRPFVVLASGYTTTALGTEFTVDTHSEEMVKVLLLSGKIVVKATPASAVPMEDQYMEPGEELHIDVKDRSVERKAMVQKAVRPSTHANRALPPQKQLPTALHFEDTPLEEVFESIAKHKNEAIKIGKINLEGLSFTGDFSSEESIQVMLQIVCQMNGLTYREDGNIIWIEQSGTTK